MLLNLVSCNGLTKKPYSAVILNFLSRLVNKYLTKRLYITEKDSKQLSMLPNDVELRIYVIDKLETYFIMTKKHSNFLCSKHHLKIHIKKNMHLIYKQEFYKDKRKEIDELFIEYLIPIMDGLDHPELIEGWKQHINDAAYENNLNQYVKLLSVNKQIDCNDKTIYWPIGIK